MDDGYLDLKYANYKFYLTVIVLAPRPQTN